MDSDDVDPATAFAALGDQVRVGILEALAADHRERSADPGTPFSTLRERVGVEDSGRFRYHLEKLRGTFVEQSEDGRYRLTYAGTAVVTAIVAGTYTECASLGPTELESTCSNCDERAIATYDDGVLVVRCRNDHPLFVWSLPANAAAERDIEELIETATVDCYQTVELTRSGTCPDCYARVETRVERADAGDRPFRFRANCSACGSTLDGPLGFCLVGHPAVEGLYRRHGHSTREGYWWDLEFVGEEPSVAVLEEAPLRIRLSVRVADETLRATVDGSGAVVATDVTAAVDPQL